MRRGVEVVDAPVSIAKAADPAPPPARRRTPRSSGPRAPSPRARPTRSSAAARPAPRWPPACSTSAATRGIYRPALALPLPVPGAPVTLLDVGANAEVRPEHLVQFAFMGAALARVVLGVERPRVGLLSNGEEATQGHAARARGARALAERADGLLAIDFVGNVEGTRSPHGAADVVVTDGFTGNVALKLMEGVSQDDAARDPRARRRRPRARKARRPAAAPGAARVARRDRPRGRRAAPTCSACAGSASCPTAASRATASRRRSCSPRAASRGDVVGRTHAALEAAGALRAQPPPARPARSRLACRRHDPRGGLRADPAHLADELELDPARIDEETRFKEDLEADSLDLYTLVQELEDSYGVKMSDEQAAKILTVGPGGRLRPRARAGDRPEADR